MVLQQLLEMHLNGVMNIKYDSNNPVANLGGVAITKEQAATICNQLGWVEYKLSPFEIIDKTNKFMKSIKNHIDRDDIWANVCVTFQNKASVSYGKTFDRILLEYPGNYSLTVIYNMEHAGAKYCVYETGRAATIAKCRNLKAVAEFINTYDV